MLGDNISGLYTIAHTVKSISCKHTKPLPRIRSLSELRHARLSAKHICGSVELVAWKGFPPSELLFFSVLSAACKAASCFYEEGIQLSIDTVAPGCWASQALPLLKYQGPARILSCTNGPLPGRCMRHGPKVEAHRVPVLGHGVQAHGLADVDEVEDVLLEAGPAKADGRVEELWADAGIRPNRVRHLQAR